MAKQTYTLAEAMQKLRTDENGLRGLVRAGKLREFREGNAMTYRIEEVDALAAQRASDSGTGEFTLEPVEGSDAPAGQAPLDSGLGLPGGLSGSSILSLEDTASLQPAPEKTGPGKTGSTAGGKTGSSVPLLDDSRTGSAVPPTKSGSGTRLKPSDSGSALSGSDVLNLEEIDREAPSEGGPRKDDTVITNVGISVFDDDDLEIAADPMAKTVAAGGVQHLGLDGSGAGSGLLDLTRESDDTSLGADVLSDIESADEVAETVEASQTVEEVDEASPELPVPATATAVAGPRYVVAGGVLPDDPTAPIFSGLLVAGMLVLAIVGSVTAAMTLDVWPGYLDALYGNLLMFAGGTVAAGGLFALIGWLVGRKPTAGPKAPTAAKPAKAPKKGKGKGE